MKKLLLILTILINLQGISQNCVVSWYETHGIVGYWFMDGNCNDDGPNNLEGVSNETNPSANRCQFLFEALNFNGLDSKVEITNTNLNNQHLTSTYSFWVLSVDSNKTQSLINCGPQNDSSSFNIVIFENGNLGVYQNGQRFESNLKPITNEWNYIYCIKNQNIISFTLLKTDTELSNFSNPTSTDTISIPNQNLSNSLITFGFNGSQNQTLNGSMDNVVIYNYNYDWLSIYSFYSGGPVIFTDSKNKVQKNNLNIYPNPTSDFITIETNGEIEISNTFGQIVVKKQINSKDKIDVKKWTKGIYILSTENGYSRFIVK
jgi:hypothetical protein